MTPLSLSLSVPEMHCGGCINRIERALDDVEGVTSARANLSRRLVRVDRDGDAVSSDQLIETLSRAGFEASLIDESLQRRTEDDGQSIARHVKALAVAGFAAGNVMMLSVSVWTGADEGSRLLFHVLSALIALPALAYSGRLFFTSAWQALRAGHVNMDVPISIGVLLATLLSVYDTLTHGDQIYFDAALMLVFFLLAGRTLERQVRQRANHAVDALSRLQPNEALLVLPDGTSERRPVSAVTPGMLLRIDSNNRLPVDARVVTGRSSVDRSHVTGESLPIDVDVGDVLLAGTRNLTADLVVEATSDIAHSFLADIERLMLEAETTRGRYRRIADRAASLYAPVVHGCALVSLIAWYAVSTDIHQSLTVAIAVLIMTCPCALGLAVPVVQVIATRRLFERGVLLRDGAALERLATVDTVIFDKTGTLTDGVAELKESSSCNQDALLLAATLARESAHPFARALVAAGRRCHLPEALGVVDRLDVAGAGVEAYQYGSRVRLGRRDWSIAREGVVTVSADRSAGDAAASHSAPRATSHHAPNSVPNFAPYSELTQVSDASQSVLTIDGAIIEEFHFRDTIRPDAQRSIDALQNQSLCIGLLSGDHATSVARVGAELGITVIGSEVRPDAKCREVQKLMQDGQDVLMIGDGANDSPAMTAAAVSMAPGSAADAGRQAADFILLHDRLDSIPMTVSIARRAHRLVRQNLTLALLYNLCAMPLAMAGWVTPLVAAISMSLSSIIVVANAMRLIRSTDTEWDSSPVRASRPFAVEPAR